MQWRAQRPASRLVGVNLDGSWAWTTTVVPTRRMAGARFPCLTLEPSDPQALVEWLNLPAVPTHPGLALADRNGRPGPLRGPFAPAWPV